MNTDEKLQPIELFVMQMNHEFNADGHILKMNIITHFKEEDWARYRETIPWCSKDWPWKLMLVPRKEAEP